MNKRLLASFLGLLMVLFQVQPCTYSVCAASTVPVNAPGERLKSDKLALEIGGGVLLLASPFIAWGIYKSFGNSVESTMRWLIDCKNKNLTSNRTHLDAQLYDQCHDKGLYPESIFEYVKPNPSHNNFDFGSLRGSNKEESLKVAVCYYGRDAVKNCIADCKQDSSDLSPYERSNCVIYYDHGTNKYMLSKYDDRRFNNDIELKRFVEYNGHFYKVEYKPLQVYVLSESDIDNSQTEDGLQIGDSKDCLVLNGTGGIEWRKYLDDDFSGYCLMG